ncbi:MAG TPA: AAA family ATPase [Steroidobacteraceae bacterium]|nr:AAA family ATPase [Steroidobacteraceae bacterium]
MHDTRVILVTGLPATGKTTFARVVAARYRLPLIGKDVIKEPLFDVLGAPDAASSRKLSDASFAVLFAMAREVGAAGSHVVLEGNFRPGEHETPLRAALPSVAPVAAVRNLAQILCRLDEGERLARLAARLNDQTRHAGHRDFEQSEAAAASGSDSFLDLAGERLVHPGADGHEVLAVLDRWWNLRTV